MPNQFSEEFRRVQDTVNTLINGLNGPTNQQQRLNDEETPISSRIPEMPGGFTPIIENNNNNNNININNNNATNPSNENESNNLSNNLSNKFNKLTSILFITIILIIMTPLYILFRIFLSFSFFILSIIIKIQKHGYKSIRNNDPLNISRRFIMKFDDRIGNKSKNININELQSNTDNITTNSNHNNNITNNNNVNNNSTDSVIDESNLVEIERPDFLECSYSQALYIVKKDITWLLVYIESSENKESIDFTNDVLINKKFLKFIKDRKFLVWGGDICDSEAFQTCNQFNITKLPFLGLLCLTVNQIPTSSGIQQSTPVLSLVTKIQGYKNLNFVLKKLDKAYKKYNPIVSQLKSNNNSQNLSNSLENEAYENSIRRTQQFRQNNIELRQNWLKWRKSKILPECNEQGQYARIAIKLPNGNRVQLKVNKNCTLEEIYAIVECNLLENIEIDSNINYTEPLNYHHQYKFDIYTLIPKELLVCDSNTIISNNSLVFPSGNLIVETRE